MATFVTLTFLIVVTFINKLTVLYVALSNLIVFHRDPATHVIILQHIFTNLVV
jgi:hypothetical protein